MESTTGPQRRSVRERIDELYRRLSLLERSGTAEGSLRQLCETLDQVEDELSGLPKQTPPPPPSEFDGRMYCPSEDFVARLQDGSILALTRGHRIEIGTNGSLKILSKLTGQPEFEK